MGCFKIGYGAYVKNEKGKEIYNEVVKPVYTNNMTVITFGDNNSNEYTLIRFNSKKEAEYLHMNKRYNCEGSATNSTGDNLWLDQEKYDAFMTLVGDDESLDESDLANIKEKFGDKAKTSPNGIVTINFDDGTYFSVDFETEAEKRGWARREYESTNLPFIKYTGSKIAEGVEFLGDKIGAGAEKAAETAKSWLNDFVDWICY